MIRNPKRGSEGDTDERDNSERIGREQREELTAYEHDYDGKALFAIGIGTREREKVGSWEEVSLSSIRIEPHVTESD